LPKAVRRQNIDVPKPEDVMQAVPHNTLPSSPQAPNMPAPLENYNAYATHSALKEGLEREGAAWMAVRLRYQIARDGRRSDKLKKEAQ